MILPTIHLNGTSKQMLLEELCKASMALNAAHEAMKRAAPNSRDMYPQGPNVIHQATEEHMDRLRRVDAVKNELDEMIQRIYEM